MPRYRCEASAYRFRTQRRASMQSTHVHIIMKSHVAHMSDVSASIQDMCILYTDDVTAYHIDLCLSEALHNIIEHAYRYETTHDIAIHFFIDQQGCSLSIMDYGQPMHVAQQHYVNQTTRCEAETEASHGQALSERGRGLLIIKQVMDEVSYITCSGQNTLTIQKRF